MNHGDRYIRAIERHRRWIVAAAALMALLFGAQLLRLELNPTPYFLDREHPSRSADHHTRDLFTNSGDTAVFLVDAAGGSICNVAYLQRIAALTAEIDAITLVTAADETRLRRLDTIAGFQRVNSILQDGLTRSDLPALRTLEQQLHHTEPRAAAQLATLRTRIAPIARTRSLTTLEHLSAHGDDIDIRPLVEQPPHAAAMPALCHEIASDPLLRGLFVAQDNAASAILVELTIREDDSQTMILMHDALQAIAQRAGPGIYLGGPPMVTAQTSQVIQHDNFILTPLVSTVMALILWCGYRRLQAVLIPLTIAGLTTLCTLGTMAALAVPLNIVTTVLPVFLISMVVADAVHLLNSYFILHRQLGHDTALRRAFTSLWRPMVFYSITTMIGFVAMLNTDLTFLRQLGAFVLLGLAVGLLLNLVLLPALLSLGGGRAAQALDDNRVILWLGQRSARLARWSMCHRAAVALLLVALAGGASLLALRIEPNNEVIGYFGEDSLIRRDESAIRERLGGTTPLNVVLAAADGGRFRQTDAVVASSELQQHLLALPHVGYVAGLTTYLDNGYRILSNSRPQQPTPEAVAQHLFLYENARDRDIRDLVDLDYRNSRLFLLADTDNTQQLRQLMESIRHAGDELLPEDITLQLTGFAELLVTSAETIVGDQLRNVALALLAIWLAMLALYRSAVIAAIAICPLTISLLLTAALMGALSIPLNIGTALIATITFGVGIDYAIHILSHVRTALREGTELETAITGAVSTLASGICINSLAVGLGCLVLVASRYQALQNLGALVACGMIVCAAITLLALPMLARAAAPAWRRYQRHASAAATA